MRRECDAAALAGHARIGSYDRSMHRRSHGRAWQEETTMRRATFITALCALAMIAGASHGARSQETLKVAVPQRGAWDAGLDRARQARRHLQEARAQPRDPLHPGRPGIDPGADRRLHRHRDRPGVSAAVGTFAKGAPIRIIGSEIIGAPDLYWYVPANSPIQEGRGLQRQDRSPIRSPARRAMPACSR